MSRIIENSKQILFIGRECTTAKKLQFGAHSDCTYRKKIVQAIVKAIN
jgi:hypothetical protein